MSKELSAKELHSLHQNPSKPFHYSGEKGLIPENTQEEKDLVEKSLSATKEFLNANRLERRNGRSDGIWLHSKRIVRITRHCGNIYPQFGYMNNNNIFLSPEEALFLLETNKLNILWNGVPFSIQQAYIVLLKTRDDLDKYKSFQKLLTLGYRIPNKKFMNKHKSSDECNLPKKMKVNTEIADAGNSKSKSKTKEDNESFLKLLNNLKTEGSATVNLSRSDNSEFSIYLSSVDVKNQEPSYEVIVRSNSQSMKFEDTSTEKKPSLISFSGVESVSFYQVEAVDLDNS